MKRLSFVVWKYNLQGMVFFLWDEIGFYEIIVK